MPDFTKKKQKKQPKPNKNKPTYSPTVDICSVIGEKKATFNCQTNPALRCLCPSRPSNVPPLTGSLH